MFGGRPEVVFPAGSTRLSWHVATSPTSDYVVGRSSSASSGCRGGGSGGGGAGAGSMAAPACSVRYFCLGALLIFVGSVLLCALGFTIVLPHEATAHWPRVVCRVVNATYNKAYCSCDQQVGTYYILPTGSEERGVLWVGSIPVAILPSCQDINTIALQLHKDVCNSVVNIRNTSAPVLRPQYIP